MRYKELPPLKDRVDENGKYKGDYVFDSQTGEYIDADDFKNDPELMAEQYRRIWKRLAKAFGWEIISIGDSE